VASTGLQFQARGIALRFPLINYFKMAKRKKDNHKKKDQKLRQEREFSRDLIQFFKKNPDKSYTARDVAQYTQMWAHISTNQIKVFLDKLAESGKIEYLSKGRYRLGAEARIVTGRIQLYRQGFGFLIMEHEEDIFIKPDHVGKSLNGDLVKVRVRNAQTRKNKEEKGRAVGEVLEVIERARTEFVGTIQEEPKIGFFAKLDDPGVNTGFYIPKDKLNGAKNGEKAILRLISWERRSPDAEVVRVLGKAGEHETEMHAILAHYGFQVDFPPEVDEAAAAIPLKIPAKEIAARRDMREILTFTIDPEDAKDFDDALSIQEIEKGIYEVGVHIADVSHYVQTGSLIDAEAFKRGTSVYLVDRTVPMLPAKLSENMCSLRPNEDKLCYSAVFRMDTEAKVLDKWIGRTVIHSDHRFTYEEAQEVMDGKREGPFANELSLLNGMSRKLREARFRKGSIGFGSEEVKFILDEHDKPIRIFRKQHLEAHELIEDFMLLANRTVAFYISNLFKNPPLPFVYRIHDLPDPEKLQNLGEFAKVFGYDINFDSPESDAIAATLNRLMNAVQGKPEQNVIETIGIRSMAKAVYSTQNIGHFGLGFPFYTHFTSPIRRYPDLLVHRLISQYEAKDYKVNQEMLEKQCTHSSQKERTAVEAERASTKYKQVEFLQDKVGQQFDGIISGVAEMGIFIELTDNLCEGMVPMRSMEDDYYEYDAKRYCLRGRNSGKVYTLGDTVRVEVASTDMIRRVVDFTLVSKPEPVKA
jgi:ribonuclease R